MSGTMTEPRKRKPKPAKPPKPAVKPAKETSPAEAAYWKARLKAIRARHGNISQEAAAAMVHADVATWRNWEQGRRIPNPMIALLIDMVFGKE